MPVPKQRRAKSSVSKPLRLADDRVLSAIIRLRGQKVMLDGSLAELYGVETRALIQAVKRNRRRFPADFMFQLSVEERARLTSQIVMSNGRGGRRTRPFAFTEQGVAMLSSVLRSRKAVEVNVEIMRAFARIRDMLAGNANLLRRLDELERRYDEQFRSVFDAIRVLVANESRPRRQIGFHQPAATP